MKVPKPSEDDLERFRRLVPLAPGVEVKKMFGNEAGFVNGNMFIGLFGPDIGLRLPDDRRDELLAVPGSKPFGPPERPMGKYAVLPQPWSDAECSDWIDDALEHVGSMPPKIKKPPTKKPVSKKLATNRPGS